MKQLTTECGVSRIGMLLFGLIIAAAVFAGSQIFPFFYYYHELLGLMESQAKKATVFSDEEIRLTLMEQIKRLEIPISGPEALKINRFNNKIVIETSYEELLYIDLGDDRVYDLYTFEFNPRVEEPLKSSSFSR